MPSLPRSLPRLCVALGLSTANQLSRAAEQEYKDGNTFLEFRLDYLQDPASGLSVIETLSKRYTNLQVLATCRGLANGGRFRGGIEAQLNLLEEAAKAGAIAIDIEIESAEKAKQLLATMRAETPIVISFHDFRTTPPLARVTRRLQQVPADAYKLVVTARKPSDNLRLIECARQGLGGTPLIAMAMSEAGVSTRILALTYGSLYTYAAPAANEGTAPGQIPGRVMRSLYHCDKLNRGTRVYGVIADPIGHTKSPVIHNRGFQARRLDAVYVPFFVPARNLREWMQLATAIPVCGFSVTIPHKQRIGRYLDFVDPLARRIGAVNTVWRKGGKWRGTNTDVDGVLKPLERRMRIAGSSILIAGYGGAARAAAIALCDAGARVSITGRNASSAAALARVCAGEAVSLESAAAQHYDALLHATPVGMAPGSKATLFPRNVPARLVFDMVYNPRETALLKRAKAQGREVIQGTEMLLEQAVRQFEIWTGESAPRAAMSKALDDSLAATED